MHRNDSSVGDMFLFRVFQRYLRLLELGDDKYVFYHSKSSIGSSDTFEMTSSDLSLPKNKDKYMMPLSDLFRRYLVQSLPLPGFYFDCHGIFVSSELSQNTYTKEVSGARVLHLIKPGIKVNDNQGFGFIQKPELSDNLETKDLGMGFLTEGYTEEIRTQGIGMSSIKPSKRYDKNCIGKMSPKEYDSLLSEYEKLLGLDDPNKPSQEVCFSGLQNSGIEKKVNNLLNGMTRG